MLKQINLGLVIIIHFKLENLLSSLLNKIANKKIQGLGRIFEELSQEIAIDDIPEKAEVIKAFSSIRNSLHNNGIHTYPSFSINVKGLNYEFIKDGVVQCASLIHIINLIQAIIDIVEEVLESETVKDIKEIIPDSFADWKANPRSTRPL